MVVHYNVRPWTAAADASVSQSKTVVLLQMSFLKFQGRELTAATFTGPGPVTCSLLVCVCVCVCVREREREIFSRFWFPAAIAVVAGSRLDCGGSAPRGEATTTTTTTTPYSGNLRTGRLLIQTVRR